MDKSSSPLDNGLSYLRRWKVLIGIGVFGDSAQKTGIDSDIWRYYLLSHRPETGDTEFSWDSFISCNNNLLLKNFGNFVSRVIKFINSRHYNNVVPNWKEYHEDSFEIFKNEINQLLSQYNQNFDTAKIRSASVILLQISQQGNGFLQSSKLDNTLAENNPSKCAAVIGMAVNLVHLLASIAEPFMPNTAKAINSQLCTNAMTIPDSWSADSIQPGHIVGVSQHLFGRIKPEKAEEWRKQFGSNEMEKEKETKNANKAKSKKKAVAKETNT